MKKVKDEKGFTLIELLVVLCIVVIICSVVSQITIKFTNEIVVDQFFEQLVLDFQRMQTLAMEEEVYANIVLLDNNTYKGYLRNDYNNPVFERVFPKEIHLNTNSYLKKIRFDKFGDIIDFGSVVFYVPYGHKTLIVNIEKGRLRLIE
nr:type II secretion system protein [Lysinibacillus timonensis]